MKKSLVVFGVCFLFVFLMVWDFVDAEENVICTDSDGGSNYLVKGSCLSPLNGQIYSDSCSSSGEQGLTSEIVYECTCISPDDMGYGSVYCRDIYGPNSFCEDGVCVVVDVNCTDSDGGKDHLVKGTCSDGLGTVIDKCINSEWMTEYSCSSPYTCEASNINCASLYGEDYVCENRACVMKDAETEEPEQPACVPEYFCAVDPPICPASGIQIERCTDFKCKTEGTEKQITCEPETCAGCELDDACIPYGFRIDANNRRLYCDMDKELKEQKTKDSEGNWAYCQNNFECESNVCTDNECVDVGAVIEEANQFKKIVFTILCKLLHPISEDNYNSCVYDFLK